MEEVLLVLFTHCLLLDGCLVGGGSPSATASSKHVFTANDLWQWESVSFLMFLRGQDTVNSWRRLRSYILQVPDRLSSSLRMRCLHVLMSPSNTTQTSCWSSHHVTTPAFSSILVSATRKPLDQDLACSERLGLYLCKSNFLLELHQIKKSSF